MKKKEQYTVLVIKGDTFPVPKKSFNTIRDANDYIDDLLFSDSLKGIDNNTYIVIKTFTYTT